MSEKILIREVARRDLIEHYVHLGEDNLDAAERLLEHTSTLLDNLARMPTMGRTRSYANPELTGIRFLPIPGFKKHLVFYRPMPGGIEVVRILHAARDLHSLFEDES